MNEHPDQHAAICVRNGPGGFEILLITSMDTGRWIPPKGNYEPDLGGAGSALAEAWEEAGVRGEVTGNAGTYLSVKGKRRKGPVPCNITAWIVAVSDVEDEYPESGMRRRGWFAPSEAAAMVAEEGLAEILSGLSAADPERTDERTETKQREDEKC